VRRPQQVWTSPVVWVAFAPLWIVVVDGFLYISLAGTIPGLRQIIPVISLVFILLLVAMAARDREALRRLGYLRVASPLWAFLSPLAYLIARAVRVYGESGRGASPLVVYLMTSLVPIALVLVAVVVLRVY
jgi:hypothetical protein